MASNFFKIGKVNTGYLWESKGAEWDELILPTVGIPAIKAGKTPPNPNPRVVYCLGCNQAIYPQMDCYGTEFKGQYRYICRRCYQKAGLEW
jgi:hypothetical protein